MNAAGEGVGTFPFNLLPLDEEGKPDFRRRSVVRTDATGMMELPALVGTFTLQPHPNRDRKLAAPCPPIVVTRDNVTELDLVLE